MDRVGGATYVLVGPNDPEGMLRHTRECRKRGYPFIADPSQQLAFGDGEMIRELIDGAAILFSNEYESALIEKKTGWSADEILDRVGTQVVTLGAEGVRVERSGRGADPGRRRCPRSPRWSRPASATRSGPGFLAALEWDLSLERAAQLGCLLAVLRRGAGRHPGVHPPAAAFVQRLRRRVRRRGGGRGRRARAHPAPLTRRAQPDAESSPSRSSTRSVAWPSSSPPYVDRNAA